MRLKPNKQVNNIPINIYIFFSSKSKIKIEFIFKIVTAQLKDGLFGLIYHPAEYDAKELFNALDSLDILSSHKLSFFDFVKARRNARLATIIDIMITRSNDELKEIESYYKKLFKKDLDNDLKSSVYAYLFSKN